MCNASVFGNFVSGIYSLSRLSSPSVGSRNCYLAVRNLVYEEGLSELYPTKQHATNNEVRDLAVLR